jgi:hypothetical protein
MSNTFTNLLPVIFSQALETLRESCVLPRLINTDFSDVPAGLGDTVNWSVPIATTDAAVSASAAPATPPDNVPTKVSVTLNQWRHAGYHLTDKEAGEISAGVKPGLQTEAIRALANRVNSYIFGLYTGVYGFAGASGTTPFASSLGAAADVRKVLGRQLAPMDDRRLVIDPDAAANALTLLANAAYAGSDQAQINGQIGRRMGLDWFEDQVVPLHTAGTITTGLIAKASTAVAAGVKSFLGTTAASTGACALVVGDVIAIGGHTTTYVVTATATQASAASDVTIAVEPGLEIPLVGSEAITVKASHRVNLGFHKNAFAFASRRLSSVAASDKMMSIADPVSGLVLRAELIRQNKQDYVDFDILYGASLIRPALAARLAG